MTIWNILHEKNYSNNIFKLYAISVLLEKCFNSNNNNNKQKLHYMNGSLSSDWVEQWQKRPKNLHRFTVKGHNISSNHISALTIHTNYENTRPPSSGRQIVSFCSKGGKNFIRQALDCNAEPPFITPLSDSQTEKAVKSIGPTWMCHRSPKQARQERTQVCMHGNFTPCYTDTRSMLILSSWETRACFRSVRC